MNDGVYSKLIQKKTIEISQLRVIEALACMPEKNADRVIESMKQAAKQIRDRKEGSR